MGAKFDGDWMQTSMGAKFYPGAPETCPIWMSDIANGLALTVRYGGQGRVDRFYSVAEHSWHLSHYAERQGKDPAASMAVLLHDAAEAYLGDIPRPLKRLLGPEYPKMETRLLGRILREYGALEAFIANEGFIKDIDNRILKHEKEELFDFHRPWPCDELDYLEGVAIMCVEARTAKLLFLERYSELCRAMGRPIEPWEV